MTFFSRIFSLFLLCGVLALVGLGSAFFYFGKDLPNYRDLAKYEPPVISRLYANDGRLFGEFAQERRVFVPINTVPDRVKQAFIAAEDQNFYHHVGVDVIAILRSAVRNVGRIANKRRPAGGSTITQQVARNFLLTETAQTVSLSRKIKEAILSLRIERAFSKDHILELYLNEIYLGQRSYGVAAAALHYFNKSLNELTIDEAAFLAGLPKAPSRYNPRTNYDAAIARRNYVIKRMAQEHYISQVQAQEAAAQPLRTASGHRAQDGVSAPYFADEVRRQVIEKYSEDALYQGGLAIRTTLDPQLQAIAHDVLREGLENYDRRHGWRGPVTQIAWEGLGDAWLSPLRAVVKPAGSYHWKLAVVLGLTDAHAVIGLEDGTQDQLILSQMKWARRFQSINALGPVVKTPADVVAVGDVILVESQKEENGTRSYRLCQIPKVSGALVALDPFTGRVKAMQGGFNYDLSQYNRVTQAMRQPGSSFKPFAFLAALEAGLTPSTLISDAPIAISLGRGLGVWKPQNFDKKFLGLMTLRRGFEGSRNAVTVRMIHSYVGMSRVIDIARRFGLHPQLPRQLAMLLGAGETTVLRNAAAYAMIANGGKHIDPIVIDRIQDRQGKTLYVSDPRQCQSTGHEPWMNQSVPEIIDPRTRVVSPEVAYQMTYLLQGVAQRGTGRIVSELRKRPYAGKTGTTNAFRDAWYAGFSPDLVVVVYVGYDDPQTLGEKEYGTRVAAPIFAAFMERALEGKPPVPFRVPPGIKHVRVNYKTGVRARAGDADTIIEAFHRDAKVPDTAVQVHTDETHQEVLYLEPTPDTGQLY